jgi:hypothetical protein
MKSSMLDGYILLRNDILTQKFNLNFNEYNVSELLTI